MGDGLTDNSARWLTLHYGRAECKAAHLTEFEKFKERMSRRNVSDDTITMLQTQIQETNTKIDALFDMIKDIRAFVISRT